VLNPPKRSTWLGTPSSSGAIRSVKPPQLIIVDLGALYGRAPHFRRPNITVLPSLHVQVVGLLDAWVLSDEGWYAAYRHRVKLKWGSFLSSNQATVPRSV
jgi:hypothetical protein